MKLRIEFKNREDKVDTIIECEVTKNISNILKRKNIGKDFDTLLDVNTKVEITLVS
jgi:hypothetical protein